MNDCRELFTKTTGWFTSSCRINNHRLMKCSLAGYHLMQTLMKGKFYAIFRTIIGDGRLKTAFYWNAASSNSKVDTPSNLQLFRLKRPIIDGLKTNKQTKSRQKTWAVVGAIKSLCLSFLHTRLAVLVSAGSFSRTLAARKSSIWDTSCQ